MQGPVSSHPLHLVGSIPRSLAKKYLPCLSKSHRPSSVQCHLLSPARHLPLTLFISHLPSQTMKHPQSLVRSQIQPKASFQAKPKALLHHLLTLHPIPLFQAYHMSRLHFTHYLTNVYHTSCPKFAQLSYLRLPQMQSTLHPVLFPYVYHKSHLAFTQYFHAQQNVHFSCSFLHSFFIN